MFILQNSIASLVTKNRKITPNFEFLQQFPSDKFKNDTLKEIHVGNIALDRSEKFATVTMLR